MLYEDEPPTRPYEPIYLNDAQGRTHVTTGIRHIMRVWGDMDRKLKRQIPRYWVDPFGVAHLRRNWFNNEHGHFCITWERLRKLPK